MCVHVMLYNYSTTRAYMQAWSLFLNFCATDILDWIIGLEEDRPAHSRMFMGILGLYPLEASSSYQLWKHKMSLDITNSPLGIPALN